MKRLFLVVLSLVSTLLLKAQNTAYDFDVTDCTGVQHHLYEELDNGYVVVLQLANMNCATCVTSGHNIENLLSSYKISHPDKVYFYSIGTDDGITCSDMLNWASANNMNHSVFAGNRAQGDYYGSATTPTVLVIANPSHRIYYMQRGYSPSQDGTITAAIEEALAEGSESGLSAVIKNSFASVFPNPFTSSVNVRLIQTASINKVSICDITGKSLLTKDATTEKLINFNTSALQKGIYFINFYEGEKISGTFKLVKKQ